MRSEINKSIEKILTHLGLDRKEFEISGKEIWPSISITKDPVLLNRNRIDMLEVDILLKENGFKSHVEQHFSGKVNSIVIDK